MEEDLLPNFAKGRDSLLQTLALMKDDEDFRRKYATIPETITSRRETSVSLLCDMLARMKRDSDAKKQCIELLDDATDGWRLILEDREKMTKTISDLKTERDELLQKVTNLEEQLERHNNTWVDDTRRDFDKDDSELTRKSSTSSSSYSSKGYDANSKSQGAQWHVSAVVDSFRKTTLDSEPMENDDTDKTENEANESSDEAFGNSSRFDNSRSKREFSRNGSLNESNYDDGMPSQFPRTDYSTINPYDRLDSTYYNPTQFYERQSSTFKRPGRRGGRGSRGGRKKSDATVSSLTTEIQSKSTRGGKTPRKKNNTKSTVDLTVETSNHLPNESEFGNTSPAPGQNDDSQEGRYFDYTTTFLDETDQSITSP